MTALLADMEEERIKEVLMFVLKAFYFDEESRAEDIFANLFWKIKDMEKRLGMCDNTD